MQMTVLYLSPKNLELYQRKHETLTQCCGIVASLASSPIHLQAFGVYANYIQWFIHTVGR